MVKAKDDLEALFDEAENVLNGVALEEYNPVESGAPSRELANKWANEIEERYPRFTIRVMRGPGVGEDSYYPDGCGVAEIWNGKGYTRLRFFDLVQFAEIYNAFKKGHDERFNKLMHGDGVPFGPRRIGKPAINPQGLEIDETPDRGDWGSMPAECAWIEANDKTLVKYGGSDIIWPNGCWVVEKAGCERQLVDPKGIEYIAHDILGMPYKMLGEGGWVEQLKKAKAQRREQMPKNIGYQDWPNDNEDSLEEMFGMTEADITSEEWASLHVDDNYIGGDFPVPATHSYGPTDDLEELFSEPSEAQRAAEEFLAGAAAEEKAWDALLRDSTDKVNKHLALWEEGRTTLDSQPDENDETLWDKPAAQHGFEDDIDLMFAEA